ncbi:MULTISPECIES: diguanylate cyclase domain-containing protein [unclassified Thioalkalivibrio]|uniref:diguanylate cyclase domain-containing protein n=1 Tax=unclassified Thioalkalivibrio TaxID=2621013 RepID=UPI0003A09F55|nr:MULTISPECIES: diguanylate cyclase [unclassified Thioalkalivibrio]
MQFSQRVKRISGRLVNAITLAFVILLAGMLVVVANSVWQNQRLLDELHHMTEERAQRIQLASDLLEAAYNRHQTMVNQVLTDDPFERDDLLMEYHRWGHRVGEVREALDERVTEAVARERLEEQDALIPEIVELQDEVVDLAARDEIEPAMAILSDRLFELDREFDISIEELRAHERAQMEAAAERAREVGANTQRFMLVFGGGGVLFALALTLVTRRTLVAMHHDLREQASRLEEAGRRLEHEATHDALTGLPNRRAFYRQLEEAIERAGETGETFSVAFIDLDQFKPVNDRLGHAAGDELLGVVARRLQEAVPEAACVARVGGDEFAVLVAGEAASETAGERLKSVVSRPAQLAAGEVTPAMTLGWADGPGDGDPDTLLGRADREMYARKAGRTPAPSL